MAIADAEYKFIFVDIGTPGRHSDSAIFRSSTFGQHLLSEPETLNIPNETLLPNSDNNCPFVFVADEAFPLLKNMMRPYPGRGSHQRMEKDKAIFNYRLSRARRVVENTFGIYAAKWRVFRRPIIASQETVVNIVKATVCLHNFLLMKKNSNYITVGLVDSDKNGVDGSGSWRDSTRNDTGLTNIAGSSSFNTPTLDGSAVRNILTHYFSNEGSVAWQEQKIHNVL